jgi:hypothetical protein
MRTSTNNGFNLADILEMAKASGNEFVPSRPAFSKDSKLLAPL